TRAVLRPLHLRQCQGHRGHAPAMAGILVRAEGHDRDDVHRMLLLGAETVVAFRHTGAHIERRRRAMATKEPGVIDIELTPEQRAQTKRETNGKLDLSTLRLRPDLNLRLQELTNVVGLRTSQGVLNGAGGLYWA